MHNDVKIPVPQYVKTVLARLGDSGKEAWLVGGCVRDALRGVPPHDYDLTTAATPAEMQAAFRGMRTIETGLAHGTLTVLSDGHPIEVTTYRIDGAYADGRHPDHVSFTDSITQDLARRDFTVNAIAYHPTRGLCDPFDGAADLAAATIRAVGDAATRFTEDGLRILRALRFAATLDFSIEPATAAALHEKSHLLQNIAAERIFAEFTKLLCGTAAGRYLHAFRDAVSVFLPQMQSFSSGNAARLDATPKDLATRMALLLAETDTADVRADLRRLRFDTATARAVETLLAHATTPLAAKSPAVKRTLAATGEPLFFSLVALQQARGTITAATADAVTHIARDVLARGDCYRINMLALGGDDLVALGVPPGKPIGKALATLLDAVVDGHVQNEKNALLAYLQTL